MSTISERVARGAAWLDENKPEWWRRVSLIELEMASPCRCVLGQVFGDFYLAPLNNPDVYEMGFDLRVQAEPGEWLALTGEWDRVITERRASA